MTETEADRKDYWKKYNAARAEARREYERERYRRIKAGELTPPAPAGICEVCSQPLPSGKRAGARYCSRSCIQKAKRARNVEHERQLRREAYARSDKAKHAERMRIYMKEYRAKKKTEK
jgi:hypothetical protein